MSSSVKFCVTWEHLLLWTVTSLFRLYVCLECWWWFKWYMDDSVRYYIWKGLLKIFCFHCIVYVVQHRSDIKFQVQTCFFFFNVGFISGVPRNFVREGGFNKFSWGQRTERTGIWGGGSPLVRGSGGSCNLVQEISFHIVKFSSFLVLKEYLWWQPIYL